MVLKIVFFSVVESVRVYNWFISLIVLLMYVVGVNVLSFVLVVFGIFRLLINLVMILVFIFLLWVSFFSFLYGFLIL